MILFTDILFPNKYARWRIEETKAFVDRGDTDFLVSKIDSYDGVLYGIDYEEMKEYFNLKDYNILIFDNKYNYLNKYNTRVDGTKWNRILNGYSYLFTKSTEFNTNNYDTFYHLFLSSYKRFEMHFPKIPSKRQFIHLYPGGGYASPVSPLAPVDRSVNLICTQPESYVRATNLGFTNCLAAYGSTSLPKNPIITQKPKNDGILRVCFSSMGSAEAKGGNLFVQVVDSYKKLHPEHNIQFYYVGTTFDMRRNSGYINFVPPMSQKKLSEFYSKSVDILVSCESGKLYNGWPLGIDAALQGSVLIGTDVHNRNPAYGYDSKAMFLIPKNNEMEIVKGIETLYFDRSLLVDMSHNIQRISLKHFSYENQQEKIFSFIKKATISISMKEYRLFCPEYEHENSSYFLLNPHKPMMEPSNVRIVDTDFYQKILESVKNKNGITVSRYNDGEWIAMLKIYDHSLYEVHSKKWGRVGQKFVDQYLTPIVSNKIGYYVGVSSEVMKKDYITNHIVPYLGNVKLFDGGLFARIGAEGNMKPLIDELRNRNVIVVGPKYLDGMSKYFNLKHVVTPENSVWNSYNRIRDESLRIIEGTNEPVVIYACSFVAKVLIDEFYNKFTSSITQLDIGAAFDLYCGNNSRPWHPQSPNKI